MFFILLLADQSIPNRMAWENYQESLQNSLNIDKYGSTWNRITVAAGATVQYDQHEDCHAESEHTTNY
jgi:hypothetical protein